MQTIVASSFYKSQCILAEGPMWHTKRKSYFWVDIDGYGFYEYALTSEPARFYKTAYKVSLLIEYNQDQLLLGLKGGLAKFDLNTNQLFWLLDIEKEIANNRCNDGACDSHGRLWIGTMDMQFKQGAGALYCIDENRTIKKKLSDVSISNGLAWSLDNSRLFYIDSPTRKVQSFIFDASSGNIQFEKDIIHIRKQNGDPDGMTIDEEGMLWIAHWGGFGVYRWNPATGEQIGFIELPVPNVSSCVFAGDSLNHLLITTARQDLSEDDLKRFPQSGDVFIAYPGVRGVKKFACKVVDA